MQQLETAILDIGIHHKPLRNLSFPELQERSLINAVAQQADTAPDFSQRIREGLPGMEGQDKTEMIQAWERRQS